MQYMSPLPATQLHVVVECGSAGECVGGRADRSVRPVLMFTAAVLVNVLVAGLIAVWDRYSCVLWVREEA